MNVKSHNRNKFYLVLVIFLFPMIASWLLYHFNTNFHFKTMNHGKLLTPSIKADYFLSDSSIPLWRIVHIDNGQCDAVCEKINYNLNQVCKVMGRDKKRLLVVPIQGNTFFTVKLQEQFNKQFKNKINVENKIYLIDPLGNIFMYYADDAKPMDILKDLKRVLEVSQIG